MRLDERMIGDLFLKASGGRGKIDERIEGDVVIVAVTGDLTVNSGVDEALRSRMHGAVRQGHRKLLVDLGGVPYIDSSGVGALISVYTSVRNRQGDVKLLNLTKHAKDLLQMTKLLTVFEAFNEEPRAVAAAAGR